MGDNEQFLDNYSTYLLNTDRFIYKHYSSFDTFVVIQKRNS